MILFHDNGLFLSRVEEETCEVVDIEHDEENSNGRSQVNFLALGTEYV